MFHKENPDYNHNQVGFYTLDELVPHHFLRQVEQVIDFSFIYNLIADTYSEDKGRPSLDPVMLVKIPIIQCFYGIRSMRQTIKDIEINTTYRWFLGLSLNDKVPHFTTYCKNYNRRFQDKEVIEEIFHYVLSIVWGQGLIDPTEIFIDGIHIKAAANNHKYTHQVLAYSTTNRDGYREYKSNSKICANCPLLSSCTESKKKQKVVTRHIWREYLELCEEIRHQKGSKELYQKHKETVERLFGTAKEYHNLHYTREVGKVQNEGKSWTCFDMHEYQKIGKNEGGEAFLFFAKNYFDKDFSLF